MDKKTIEVNRLTYINMAEKLISRSGINDLLNWLDTGDFYSAPASTKFHLAEPGGLCKHSLNVLKAALILHEGWCMGGTMVDYIPIDNPEYIVRAMNDIPVESIALCAMFHDLCKINTYKPTLRNKKSYEQADLMNAQRWQIKEDKLGSFVWVTEDSYNFDEDFPLGHGEKSLYYVMKFMQVDDSEAQAIRYHMGFNGQYQNDNAVSKVYEKNTLSYLINAADMAATYLFESLG